MPEYPWLEEKSKNDVALVAESAMFDAEEVVGCVQFDFGNTLTKNPFYAEGETDSSERLLPPHRLMEKLVAEGWVVAFMGWIRDDGSTNFNHEPAVTHKLAVVMVKLKK